MSEFLKVCGEYISMYLSLIFYSQTLLIFAESLSLVFSSYEIETTHVGLFLFGDFSLSGHVVFFSFRLGPLLSKEFFWGHSFSPKLCFYLLKIKVSPADAVSLLSPPKSFFFTPRSKLLVSCKSESSSVGLVGKMAACVFLSHVASSVSHFVTLQKQSSKHCSPVLYERPTQSNASMWNGRKIINDL